MSKPPIEFRPSKKIRVASASYGAEELLEAYKAQERAKVLARVKKHRARQKAAKT